MAFFQIDNPHVRRSYICPMCHEGKRMGSVVCSECHYNTEYGTEDQRELREAAIEAAEDRLIIEEERLWANEEMANEAA